MKVMTTIQQILFTTVRLEVEKEDGLHLGTGFIFSHQWGEGKIGDFLVSNRHVVSEGRVTRFYFIREKNKAPDLGNLCQVNLQPSGRGWFFHPNPQIDVAAIPLASVINELESQKVNVYCASVGPDIMADRTMFENFDAIEDVLIVG